MKVDLSKTDESQALTRSVRFDLVWETNWVEADLDVVALLLNAADRIKEERSIVFCGNPTSRDGSAVLGASDRASARRDRHQSITVDLQRVDPCVNRIVFGVSIYDAVARGLNFGQISSPRVVLCDKGSGAVLHECDLDEDFSVNATVECSALARRGQGWTVEKVCIGHSAGLPALLQRYAPSVDLWLDRSPRTVSPEDDAAAPVDMLREAVFARGFAGYCEAGDRELLLRQGTLAGLDRDFAETVVDLELDRLGIANEASLIRRLDSLLRRFTDDDRKLDDKERRDALQMTCRPPAGFSQGLRLDVAEAYVLKFCRERAVKVKVGMLRWAVP